MSPRFLVPSVLYPEPERVTGIVRKDPCKCGPIACRSVGASRFIALRVVGGPLVYAAAVYFCELLLISGRWHSWRVGDAVDI